ncbi:hypothetical protein [Noviherbaspirillum pedocola]|uniref:Uncharacterized protein n=1 Tax=Noviherbaspirillum pedocola TaxID=2801341 RepID=A0A934W9K4_9BURK|nr:hypothetical protein [Noviherbaspirillum pedocola]MBK4738238.1 hypothetical protein [Noviherbaspirillum pedocola]
MRIAAMPERQPLRQPTGTGNWSWSKSELASLLEQSLIRADIKLCAGESPDTTLRLLETQLCLAQLAPLQQQ